MLQVREATPQDALYLAPRLRKADRDEMLVSYDSPLEALMDGLQRSSLCYVAVDENDLPYFMGGVVPSADPLVGLAWAGGSDAINHHRRCFLKSTHEWMRRLHEGYPVLANMVDARNTLHIRWLQWAGFIFINTHQVEGLSFHEFVRLHHV